MKQDAPPTKVQATDDKQKGRKMQNEHTNIYVYSKQCEWSQLHQILYFNPKHCRILFEIIRKSCVYFVHLFLLLFFSNTRLYIILFIAQKKITWFPNPLGFRWFFRSLFVFLLSRCLEFTSNGCTDCWIFLLNFSFL